MKYIEVLFLVAFSLLCIVSCYDEKDEFSQGTDYTLSSQDEVNRFTGEGAVRTMTIQGENITDISNLKINSAITLIIENTGIEELVLPNLYSIKSQLIIRNNEKLLAISNLEGFRFMSGTVNIDNNPKLENIAGFMNLKTFTGTLNISNNVALGEDFPNAGDYTYGFFPIKYLMEKNVLTGAVTLVNNHPGAATSPQLIGQMGMGAILDYTITSQAEADAFTPKSEAVNNLTFKGLDVTDKTLNTVARKIKEVVGTTTIENTSVTTSEGFFDVLAVKGGVVLRNNKSGGGLFNANGFKAYTEIGGDLIIDNCPGIAHWGPNNTFSQIQHIKGSLIVKDGQMAANAFGSLTTVDGDFEIVNCNVVDFWNLSGGKLKIIGGNFTYTHNAKVNGLAGLEGITHIGGNVTITHNGTNIESIGEIPEQSIPGRVGWCLVKAWIEEGIVSPEASVKVALSTGTPVDLSKIESCGTPSPSYVLNGLSELEAFIASSEDKQVVDNITISGSDISDHAISLVQNKVSEVKGTVTWNGLTQVTTTENFFEKINCKGGIVIKGCTALNNANGLKGYTEIGGDFVIEGSPNLPTADWGAGNCLSNITKIKGSLIFKGNNQHISGITFYSLKEVGGDFIATDNNGPFWNFGGMTLEKIGGNLIIENNDKVNGLGGLEHLTSIGGDITIWDNGLSDPIPSQSTSNQIGLCLIKGYKDAGIATGNMKLGTTSNPVDVDSLTPCE